MGRKEEAQEAERQMQEGQGMYEDSSEEEEEEEDDTSERALVPGDSTDSFARPQETVPEPNAFDQAPVNVHKLEENVHENNHEHENGGGLPHNYERLQEEEEEREEEEEEDSADLEMDPVERIQPMREEDKDLVDEAAATESRPADHFGAMEGVEEEEDQQQTPQAAPQFPQESEVEREEGGHGHAFDEEQEEEEMVQKTDIGAVESAPVHFEEEQMVEDESREQDVPAGDVHEDALYQGGVPAAVSQMKSDAFEEEEPATQPSEMGIVNQGFTDDVDMEER